MMSPDALGRLVDQHAAALALYASQWCPAPEDVVQEAFLKLVMQEPSPTNPAAWLFRVVRNAAVSAARLRRRQRKGETAAAQPVFSAPEGGWLDPAEAAAALDSLPAEQRESIVAHLWGRLTFEEIANLTGTSSSTANRRYLAGLVTLRERLGIPCPTHTTSTSLRSNQP